MFRRHKVAVMPKNLRGIHNAIKETNSMATYNA